jgi:hypothetical protein
MVFKKPCICGGEHKGDAFVWKRKNGLLTLFHVGSQLDIVGEVKEIASTGTYSSVVVTDKLRCPRGALKVKPVTFVSYNASFENAKKAVEDFWNLDKVAVG